MFVCLVVVVWEGLGARSTIAGKEGFVKGVVVGTEADIVDGSSYKAFDLLDGGLSFCFANC